MLRCRLQDIIEQTSSVFAVEGLDEELAKAEVFHRLAVRRVGSMSASNMTTLKLDEIISDKLPYRFRSRHGIERIDRCDPGRERVFVEATEKPVDLHVCEFQANWASTESRVRDDANILGGYGSLLIAAEEGKLRIPVMDATEETLSYFKAHLLQDGDCFHFQNSRSDFPIFTMDVGVNYVPNYIVKYGHGFYLEYHETPHYHEPIDEQAGGYYLLAKKVTEDDERGMAIFHVAGFRVPLGCAVYTEPNAIHADMTVLGKWRVGYTNAQRFSTVLLRTPLGDLSALEFYDSSDFVPAVDEPGDKVFG